MSLFKVWLVQYRQEIIEAPNAEEAEMVAKWRNPGFVLEAPTDNLDEEQDQENLASDDPLQEQP